MGIAEGNMWGQEWGALLKRVKPYPNVGDADSTEGIHQREFRALKFAELADEFYRSIGLYEMTPTFWKKSIFERPADGRSMDCHASAFNMRAGDDYR